MGYLRTYYADAGGVRKQRPFRGWTTKIRARSLDEARAVWEERIAAGGTDGDTTVVVISAPPARIPPPPPDPEPFEDGAQDDLLLDYHQAQRSYYQDIAMDLYEVPMEHFRAGGTSANYGAPDSARASAGSCNT